MWVASRHTRHVVAAVAVCALRCSCRRTSTVATLNGDSSGIGSSSNDCNDDATRPCVRAHDADVDVRYGGDSNVLHARVRRRRGVVVQWHAVERRGVIREVHAAAGAARTSTAGDAADSASEHSASGTARTFVIASARAFETALPSLLWDLTGATVTFTADTQPCADRVIVRTRSEPITARSYERAPPIHFARFPTHATYVLPSPPLHAAAQLDDDKEQQQQQQALPTSSPTTAAAATTRQVHVQHDSSSDTPAPSSATDENSATTRDVPLYAKDIVVELHTLTAAQRARVRGPLLGDGAGGDDTPPPTRHLKDLRNSRLLDRETDLRLRLRRHFAGDEAAVRAAMAAHHAAQPRRVVVATGVRGRVVAWSPMHRSGLIADDATAQTSSSSSSNESSSSSTGATGAEQCEDSTGQHTTAATATAAATTSAVTTQLQHSIIRSAHSFDTALSTWSKLLQCRVTYVKVTYTSQPDKHYAEQIVVDEADMAAAAANAAGAMTTSKDARKNAQQQQQRTRSFGQYYADEDDDDDGDIVDDMHKDGSGDATTVRYGVIVRWSGGHGVVQAARTAAATTAAHTSADDSNTTTAASPPPPRRQRVRYYIRSAAAFVQLVDTHSRTLRGAVVRFRPDRDDARYACEVDILSTASTVHTYNVVSTRQQQLRDQQQQQQRSMTGDGDEQSSMHTPPPPSSSSWRTAATTSEMAAEVWREGVLLSYSPLEGQGIIVVAQAATQEGSNGNNDKSSSNNDNDNNKSNNDNKSSTPQRFVLRDAADCVVDYAGRKPLLHKGRRVRFSTHGEDSRVAVSVHVLPGDSADDDEALLRAAELRAREPRLTLDGDPHKAIASPMSTNYWITRLDKAGFDVSDVRRRRERASGAAAGGDNKQSASSSSSSSASPGSDTLPDSEDMLKADPWWNDPQKNKRIPGTNMTFGHLALIGPASMLNTAIKARDPVAREAMTKRYAARLTDQQRAYAMQQAKELAPKYEALIKEARERNEEPTFYYT